MEINLILSGKATLEDLYELYEKRNIVCIAENGKITHVIEGGEINVIH